MKALIACDGNGNGCVLEYSEGLAGYIEDTCPTELSQVGFDDAPKGINVWEGTLVGGQYNGWQGDYDDVLPEGLYRDLTAEEWQAIIEKKKLFEDSHDL